MFKWFQLSIKLTFIEITVIRWIFEKRRILNKVKLYRRTGGNILGIDQSLTMSEPNPVFKVFFQRPNSVMHIPPTIPSVGLVGDVETGQTVDASSAWQSIRIKLLYSPALNKDSGNFGWWFLPIMSWRGNFFSKFWEKRLEMIKWAIDPFKYFYFPPSITGFNFFINW